MLNEHAGLHVAVERELIDAEREAMMKLRAGGEIDDVVLRRVQADLDPTAAHSAFKA